jgi:nitrite reductase/ring-hydroxylating ferredoxin subunit
MTKRYYQLTLIKVCSLDMVPRGSQKTFRVKGLEILVINFNGELFCLQGRCTHAGAPLAEGTVEDNILTCPWHGSKFRITTGEVIKNPATKNLATYKYTISDNSVYVDL